MTLGKGGVRNHPLCQARLTAATVINVKALITSLNKDWLDDGIGYTVGEDDSKDGKGVASDIDIETLSIKGQGEPSPSMESGNFSLIQKSKFKRARAPSPPLSRDQFAGV